MDLKDEHSHISPARPWHTHLFQPVVSSDLCQRTFQNLPAGQSIQCWRLGLVGGSLRLRLEGRGEGRRFRGRGQGEGLWRGGD